MLHLGDAGSLVDLGTFRDIIYNHKTELPLEFSFDFDIPGIKIVDASTARSEGICNQIKFETILSFDTKSSKLQLDKFQYALKNGNEIEFSFTLEQGKYKLAARNYNLLRQKGRAWTLPPPENFFGFPDEAIAYYQNTGFLADLSLAIKNLFKSVYYVGPLRDHPERFYQFSGEVQLHVGEKVTLAINALLAAKDRKISRGFKMKSENFEELMPGG